MSKEDDRPSKGLLDSSDDFEQALPKRSKMARRRAEPKEGNNVFPLPPCPLCGKVFGSGTSASARSSHLGQCGRAKGISTERLIRVRRLEEKQAKERMELVGSQLAVKSDQEGGEKKTTSVSAVRKEEEISSKKSKKVKEQVDPHLELALALSASIATTSVAVGETATKDNGSLNLPRAQPPKISTTSKKKAAGTTTLEQRTDAERERQISARVEGLLVRHQDEQDYKKSLSVERRWWSAAASSSKSQSYNGILEGLHRATKQISRQPDQSKSEAGSSKSGKNCQLSQDWLRLFLSGEGADVAAYSKDQKEVRFHSLVAKARCPRLLDGAVVEQDEDGEERTIVSLDMSETACRIFLGYLYSARLTGDVLKKSDFDGLTKAAAEYGLSETFGALLEEEVDQGLLVPEEEEDEWVRLNEESSTAVNSPISDIERSQKCVRKEESVKTGVMPPPALPPSSSPAASVGGDEDLFGDEEDLFGDEEPPAACDEQASTHTLEACGEKSELEEVARENVNDNVWDDFDYDAGGDVYMSSSQASIEQVDDDKVTDHACLSSTPKKNIVFPAETKYENMLTPELRKELKRFGLKVIPRRKAVPLLNHIQKETRKRRRLDMEEEDGGTTDSTADDSFQMEEESVLGAAANEEDEDDVMPPPSSEAAAAGKKKVLKSPQEVSALLRDFLLGGDADTAAAVLTYEPLWLEDTHAAFKAGCNARCRLSDFMDALDAECVTFRTRASAERRRVVRQGGAATSSSPKKRKRIKAATQA